MQCEGAFILKVPEGRVKLKLTYSRDHESLNIRLEPYVCSQRLNAEYGDSLNIRACVNF